MKRFAGFLTACAFCALSLVFLAVPARADLIDPTSQAGGFLGIVVVAAAAAVGAFTLIAKRKR